jgi:hypothetical protein
MKKIGLSIFSYIPNTLGFRLFYLPGPTSSLCSNGGIIPTNLNVTIDTSEKLTIYESFLGKNSFAGYTTFFLSFAGCFYAVLCSLYLLGLKPLRIKSF